MKDSEFRLNEDGSISLLWNGDINRNQLVLRPEADKHQIVNILNMAYYVGKKDLRQDLKLLLEI